MAIDLLGALEKAYQNLEKEFTKKSQQLKRLQKENCDADISSEENVLDSIERQQKEGVKKK